ncbi:MAG: hypothetical protein OH316_00685 [Candidatus Parvarchaeota archaeon]|nr:hypothetical protein [Candidatus Parvarchaeota archaeon]MCW1301639.1 hypothetical protein [Candidatus Parvarchaeota archaeon]
MKGGLVLLGLIITVIGAIIMTGISLPYFSSFLTSILKFSPVSSFVLSIAIIILGIIIFVIGAASSKMGKYYRYY